MSGEDVNPFADPNDVNPFADPSVVNHHTTTQPTLDDYNPFDGQKSQTSYSTQPEPPAQYTATLPATIEPTNKQGFQAKPFSSTDDTSKQRQDELERKAAELDRKEQELKAMQARIGNNNFPPFPKFFCVKPCFYHDIELEIPMESQKTCRMLYYIWQLYVLTLILNFASALALMCDKGDKGAETFGISLLYLVLFTPCSFIFWYWPIYKALRSDSSFSYMVFFFVFFFQIIFTVIYAIGIPGFGTCGWINSARHFEDDGKSKAVAVMMFICGTLFSLLALFKVLLLRKVHSAYRTSGASLEKAQGEFARGVASNKDVQKAAAQAVATGVSEGIGRQ
ncbi:secretory carrier-associated membrane protein 2-like isoform X1 [Hydractinia symbiolongicarpus]|uniref:secretory carrier-associated membrane protein 2-like isoform X1 n=1 Tax=Hydractinia symbiolongicarpus TaxID=13093 RepID=UPI00254BD3E6|nr:secretory carrier-associated membrane protein 2-like isoform X1 [Hydractinia symbiolongicarpus]